VLRLPLLLLLLPLLLLLLTRMMPLHLQLPLQALQHVQNNLSA